MLICPRVSNDIGGTLSHAYILYVASFIAGGTLKWKAHKACGRVEVPRYYWRDRGEIERERGRARKVEGGGER